MDLKLFGEMIAVSPIEEEMAGELQLPENRERLYDIGVVKAVGNGRVTEKPRAYEDQTKFWVERPIHIKVGDKVLFRIPAVATKPKTFVFEEGGRDKDKILMIHQGDIIATLTSSRVDIDTFKIAGEFLLLEWFQTKILTPDSKIELPDNASVDLIRLRFHVLQIGPVAFPDPENQVKVGEEVLVDRLKLEPIKIAEPFEKQGEILLAPKTKDYVFCHRDHVFGVAGS